MYSLYVESLRAFENTEKLRRIILVIGVHSE